MATHGGTDSRSRWSSCRYADGLMPTISENRVLKDPSDVQPTSTQLSVTDIPDRSNDCARSIRRVIR